MTMTIVYLRYLKYVVRHKYFVMKECFRSGLIWRGMLHDNSKFLPSEFIPYAKFFYGNVEPKRDDTGYYKPTDTGCVLFDFAWLLHQKRNDHHWQWWILPEDNGGIKVLEMSYDSIIEMVCDWVGAGKAQGFASPPNEPMRECQQWYESNKHKMNLHATTRAIVEYILYCNDWEKRYFPMARKMMEE